MYGYLRPSRLIGLVRNGVLGRVLRDSAGTAVIEAAIALPMTVVMIGGAMELGRYYWMQNSMQLALEETARYVMVSGTTAQTTLQTYLRSKVEAGTASSVAVSVDVTASGTMSYATVTAQYSFQSTLSMLIPAIGTRQILVRVTVPVIS